MLANCEGLASCVSCKDFITKNDCRLFRFYNYHWTIRMNSMGFVARIFSFIVRHYETPNQISQFMTLKNKLLQSINHKVKWIVSFKKFIFILGIDHSGDDIVYKNTKIRKLTKKQKHSNFKLNWQTHSTNENSIILAESYQSHLFHFVYEKKHFHRSHLA